MAKGIGLLGILGLLAAPFLSLAQVAPPAPLLTNFDDLADLLATAIRWMFTLIVAICVIFILYGAFLYVTAGGDSAQVSKANQTLLFAAIGLAVALLTSSIIFLIRNFLGASGPSGLPSGLPA